MKTNAKPAIRYLLINLYKHSQKQTLDYLCVQPDEIKEVYMLGVE
jgi:hypothetical protein